MHTDPIQTGEKCELTTSGGRAMSTFCVNGHGSKNKIGTRGEHGMKAMLDRPCTTWGNLEVTFRVCAVSTLVHCLSEQTRYARWTTMCTFS